MEFSESLPSVPSSPVFEKMHSYSSSPKVLSGEFQKVQGIAKPIVAFHSNRMSGKSMKETHRSAVHIMTVPGTKLEGNIFSSSMACMSGFLEDYSGNSVSGGDHIAKETSMRFRDLEGTSKEIERIEVMPEGQRGQHLEALASNLKEKMRNLPSGEKLLIPGGTNAHAMLYEAEKISDGKWRFTIVNTGDGMKRYHQESPPGGGKYDPEYVIEDIPEENLSKDFIGGLLGLQVRSSEVNVEEIYQMASVEKLGGWKRTGMKGAQAPIRPQKLGTCTYKVLTAYLRAQYVNAGNLRGYKRLKVISKVNTLNNLIQSDHCGRAEQAAGFSSVRENPGAKFIRLASATLEKSLLGTGSEKGIGKIEKMISEGILTEEEANSVRGMIESIRSNENYAYDSRKIFEGLNIPLGEYSQGEDLQSIEYVVGVDTVIEAEISGESKYIAIPYVFPREEFFSRSSVDVQKKEDPWGGDFSNMPKKRKSLSREREREIAQPLEKEVFGEGLKEGNGAAKEEAKTREKERERYLQDKERMGRDEEIRREKR